VGYTQDVRNKNTMHGPKTIRYAIDQLRNLDTLSFYKKN
jgi:hypothetical protein